MYEKVILWATPAFFLLIAIEIVVGWRRRRSQYRVADALNSIALGQMSTYIGVFGRIISFGLYVLIYEKARVVTLDSTSVWAWIVGLLLYDFLYYWYHRFGHEVNVLWAAHVVHHQSEEFNLSTALRQTGTSYLFSWVFYVPMAVLGFPPALLLGVGLIDLLYQFWIHTEHIGSLGVFDRLFASPSNHRVHHAVNDRYVDRNYGGLLIVWDRLFGTFQPELREEPVVYGTRDPLHSWNPLWANLHSYAGIARDSWHARAWGDKLRVWIKHPGWRPLDVSERYPKAPFQLSAVAKFDRPLPTALAVYCVVQSVLVLGLGTHFLAVVPGWATAPTVAYLAWLVLCLCVIGGLIEGRRGYLWAETLRVAAFGVIAAAIVGVGVPFAREVIGLISLVMIAWLWAAGRSLSGRDAPQFAA